MVAQAKRWVRTSNVGPYIKNATQKPDSKHYFFRLIWFSFEQIAYLHAFTYLADCCDLYTQILSKKFWIMEN